MCTHANCFKSFNEKGNLKTHMKIHSKEKPLKCIYQNCAHFFRTHSHLKAHMKTHLYKEYLSCEICKERFYSKGMLNIHMYNHRIDPVKRDYNDEELNYIIKNHGEDYIKKIFNNEYDFKTHINIVGRQNVDKNSLNDYCMGGMIILIYINIYFMKYNWVIKITINLF